MSGKYNPATLSLQCDRELVKAGYDCQNMGDEELLDTSEKLYEDALRAHTVSMAQIIRSVRNIYTDERTRRDNLESTRLFVAIMLRTDDLL